MALCFIDRNIEDILGAGCMVGWRCDLPVTPTLRSQRLIVVFDEAGFKEKLQT